MTDLDSAWCAIAARRRGEELAGTASEAVEWLVLESRQPWSSTVLEAATEVQTVTGSRVVVARGEGCERVTRVCSLPGREGLITLQADMLGVSSWWEDPSGLCRELAAACPVPAGACGPLALVCIQGSRDRCCGTSGPQVLRALRQRGIRALGCTHLGGDRFAPVVAVLPHGIMYGHLDANDADALAWSILNEEILLRKYRGRSAYSFPAQYVEVLIRRQWDLQPYGAVRVSEASQMGPDAWTVTAETATGAKKYRVTRSRGAPALLTCNSRSEASPYVWEAQVEGLQ